MQARGLLLCLLCVGAAGCTSGGPSPSEVVQPALYPPAVFAHRVSSADLSVYWNCTRPESNVTRLDGVVQNTGGGTVRFPEVELVAVDARDRSIASVKTALRDIVLQTNQMAPFQLGLPTAGTEARLDLYYEYRVRPRFGFEGFQFSTEHFRARDVCSDTQHRVPKPQ